MKKKFDLYQNKTWKRNKEREKNNYPNEPDPLYWDYVDIYEEIMKHPRIIQLSCNR